MKNLVLYLVLFCGFCTSCVEKQLNQGTQSVTDFHRVMMVQHQAMLAVIQLTSHHDNDNKGNFITYGSCGKLVLDSNSTDSTFPRKGILNFGTKCNDSEKNTRAGILHFELNKSLYTEGARLEMVMEEFEFNGLKMNGEIRIDFNKADNESERIMAITCKNMAVFFSEEDKVGKSWKPQMVYTWTEGLETLNPLDDRYEVKGTFEAMDSEERVYEVSLTEDLIIKNSCGYIVQGIMLLKPQYLLERRVDFGSGSCDASVDLTIDDEVQILQLQ